MVKALQENTSAAIALVCGLVDVIPIPAFVTSPTIGFITSNKLAKRLAKSGLDLYDSNIFDGQLLTHGNREYKVCSKKLNHRTDFVLNELHDVTTSVKRMQYAGMILSQAIEGAPLD